MSLAHEPLHASLAARGTKQRRVMASQLAVLRGCVPLGRERTVDGQLLPQRLPSFESGREKKREGGHIR